jgi:uncharacterized protein YprB with RNaseH-like and TPR domain
MSKLKDKLERRPKSGASGKPTSEMTSSTGGTKSRDLIEQLRKRMEKVARKHAPVRGAKSFISSEQPPTRQDPAGEVVDTENGTVLLIKRSYPPSYRHGRYFSCDFIRTGAGLTDLCGDFDPGDLDPRGALFLDTETTGLSGGTGTLPFLVGVGWLERDGRFQVEQLFCRDPSEERAQLELLAARLAGACFLVTFNGRAFDMPLINTRFILQRMKNPGYDLKHLDLLLVARRVFKRRLESCSLGSLESAVLGLERVGDISGHAIPGVYAAYVRGGPSHRIDAVLEHNALDLVGLAALGAALEEMYEDPSRVEHAADHLGLARAAFAAGKEDKAEEHLSRAGESGGGKESREAYLMATKAALKRGEPDRAKSLLQKALLRKNDDAFLHLALAKHLEHRDKSYEEALLHARQTSEAEGRDATARRVARLERRRARNLEKRRKK